MFLELEFDSYLRPFGYIVFPYLGRSIRAVDAESVETVFLGDLQIIYFL